MAKRLYVAWQDETTRKWHTIAMLTKYSDSYELAFTAGSEHLRAIPKDLFRMDTTDRFRFEELISLFKNRLPPKSRPDFHKMASWLNLSGTEDEFTLLSKFGLIPGTDAILLYPEPTIVNNFYSLEFFAHGIRHMHRDVTKWCGNDLEGVRLLPLLDIQNPADRCAIALKSENDTILVGYVPTFYSSDFWKILSDVDLCQKARITVVKNNDSAPSQLKLLCRFTSPVKSDFVALDTPVHKPLMKVTQPI